MSLLEQLFLQLIWLLLPCFLHQALLLLPHPLLASHIILLSHESYNTALPLPLTIHHLVKHALLPRHLLDREVVRG